MIERQAPLCIGFVGAGNIAQLHLAGIARYADRVTAAAMGQCHRFMAAGLRARGSQER